VATLHERERAFRRAVIAETLAAHRGHRANTARALGITRTYLLRLMRMLGLQDYGRGSGRAGSSCVVMPRAIYHQWPQGRRKDRVSA
jgi:hypothetical protein